MPKLRDLIWDDKQFNDLTPTIDEQIEVIKKVLEYKIFQDDERVLRAILDNLYATRFIEKAKVITDPMRIVK